MASGGSIKFDVQVTGYWQRCPVCEGRGWLPHGFYRTSQYFGSTSTADECCRRCNGTGTIATPTIAEAIATSRERKR